MNSFYQTSITLISKPHTDTDNTTKENYRPTYLMNTDIKTLSKVQANSTAYLKSPWSTEIYSWDARMVQHLQINKCDLTQSKFKIILFLQMQKNDLTKIPYAFMIKTSNTESRKEMYINIIKARQQLISYSMVKCLKSFL